MPISFPDFFAFAPTIYMRDPLAEFLGAAPVRGEIRIDLAAAPDAGVTGIIASIATLITGATAETGFNAMAEEQILFRRLWQDRVRRILLEHADDPAVIRTSKA